MNLYRLLRINLKMFDGEAAGAATPPAEGGNAANAQQQSGETVIYGIQDTGSSPDAQDKSANKSNPEKTETSVEARKTAYAKFKEEYKDMFGEDVKGLIKQRFKNNNGLEQKLAQVSPILDLLMDQHGVSDYSALHQLIQNNAYVELAEKDGLTVDQVKQIHELKSQNRQLQNKFATEQEEKATNQRIADWYSQADTVKQKYPSFDLAQWAGNEKFLELLSNGVQVEAAYELCDLENIKKGIAQQVQSNVVKDIQARGQRPTENATKPTQGVVFKNSVKDLTDKDLDEIVRRVRNGEKIRF